MGQGPDLILVTDEPIDWEGDYWAQSARLVERQQGNIGITEADKIACEEKFGVRDYFRKLPEPKSNPDPGCARGAYRIRVPHRPHLSLVDLATVATQRGYDVRIIDNVLRYPHRFEQLKRLMDENPKAIGISTTFLLTPTICKHYVDTIRELNPDVAIVLGGPTVRKVESLHGYADFAVFGDGEEPMLGILEVIDGKRAPETVAHIAFKQSGGPVGYGEFGRESGHVDVVGKAFKARDVHIPVADWTLAHRGYDNVFAIEFSRGCKYNCFYCSYDRGKNIRALDEVKEELIRNAELGITKYRVSDSNFTDGPPRYKNFPHDICKLMIELDLGLKWSCYARVDDLQSPGLADLMKEAGCFGVFFGIESGSNQILKNMRKGHNAADAADGVRIAQEAGIRSHASFIVGYPGETEDTHEETLEFIEANRPDTVNIGQFRVEHDTPVYGVEKFQLDGEGMQWRHKTMDSEQADQLVKKANQRLLQNGVSLGTEYSFPTFMGLGLTFEESRTMIKDMDLIGQEDQRGKPHWAASRERLRQVLLERFPAAIAKDQEQWNSVLDAVAT